MSDLIARVEHLERDVAEIKSVLGRVEPVLGRIDRGLAELSGRAGAMPTTWQLITLLVAVMGAVAWFANTTNSRVDRIDAKVESIASRLAGPAPR